MEAKNKHYPEEFKKQIVELYENGKSMQRRIAELEMENEILKKATAIFAKTK